MSKKDHDYELAGYACDPSLSNGRLYPERTDENKTCFQIDRDRIIHSAAFRKLSYKTQVFSDSEGDYYHTRLTHSLEVAQIARSLCRVLRISEDLAETIALAHDLGHPPFGHAGEEGLNKAMAPYGGFDHNIQTFKIVAKLECRHMGFDGMNLSWEILEGIVKHNGPLPDVANNFIAEYNALHNLELDTFPTAEAQVAAIADDIAYCNHDMDDGLRAGLFAIEDLAGLPVIGPEVSSLDLKNFSRSRIISHVISKSVACMVEDVVEQTAMNIKDNKIEHSRDVRLLNKPLVHFSGDMLNNVKIIKKFLRDNVYSYYKVNRVKHKARHVVYSLFILFYQEPWCLPDEWRQVAESVQDKARALVVCDFIAGMTDRFALYEYSKILL
jgi:dGTPase